MMKTYEINSDLEEENLEDDAEYMYHRGFCEAAERWIRRLGMSTESPIVEKMIREHM